ncbi:hypothetical protein AB0I28_24625 [Phytomonospora sp. NPDC050363]|uniref:hypothetical protein n=1 Tax=Phytomonospora sp. NPDC050363 TaxID=3155642 RepID=UPI0033F9805B
MGVFTEYFIAERDDITAEIIESGPERNLPAEDMLLAKGVDPVVMLGQLGEQLTGADFLDIGDDEKSWLWSPGGEVPEDPELRRAFLAEHGVEASVHESKDRLRDALADIADEEVAAVAARWATIEEWGEGVTGPDVEWFIEGLIALTRRARTEGKHLYCWWSL